MPRSDFDEAWKEFIDGHLESFLTCFFPAVAAAIDWTRPFEFLDQELREVIHDTAVKCFRVDRLIKVHRREGGEQWLLVHLEIQSFGEGDFALRIYHYNHGIHRARGIQPLSLVVLADLDPDWKPCEYVHEELACGTRFRFLTCKLLDEMGRLEHDHRLPAVAAKAQIEALRTTGDPARRFEIRWRMTRALYDQGFSGDEIRIAYRILSWMMRLPKEMQLTFRDQIVEFERREHMPYVTDIEELGIERGIERGIVTGIERGIEAGIERGVGEVTLALLERVCGVLDAERRARVQALPVEKAKELALALLAFRSVADLDDWLGRHG